MSAYSFRIQSTFVQISTESVRCISGTTLKLAHQEKWMKLSGINELDCLGSSKD